MEMNKETVEALNEYDEMKEYPENYKQYESFDEALKEELLSKVKQNTPTLYRW